MQHAMYCIIRLIRVLLGPDAVKGKFECGISLVVLGVQHEIYTDGVRCRPSAAKIEKWLLSIREALQRNTLSTGDAQKLAGRLNWAASKLFHRFGRALLRPIYEQCVRYNSEIDKPLRHALIWWECILSRQICEVKAWHKNVEAPVHVFCDARGSPPHLAAVLLTRHECVVTHMPAPQAILEMFVQRSDAQIMGLELLGLALALSTFAASLRGKRVVMHCDNSGAEVLLLYVMSVLHKMTSVSMLR